MATEEEKPVAREARSKCRLIQAQTPASIDDVVKSRLGLAHPLGARSFSVSGTVKSWTWHVMPCRLLEHLAERLAVF